MCHEHWIPREYPHDLLKEIIGTSAFQPVFYSTEHGTESMKKKTTEGFHNSNLWNIQYNKENKTLISWGKTEWSTISANY